MKRSGDLVIARDRVIGKAAYPCHPERARVELSETSVSRRTPAMPIPQHAASGSSYETSPTWHLFTTETRRHGEDQEGLLEIDCSPKALTAEFPDHPITCDHPITRFPSALVRIAKAARTLLAALREIFDESAYERFLLRTERQRSIESYRIFMIERDAAAATRPRCC